MYFGMYVNSSNILFKMFIKIYVDNIYDYKNTCPICRGFEKVVYKYTNTKMQKLCGVLPPQSLLLSVLWNPIAASVCNSARLDGNSFIPKGSLWHSKYLSIS